MTKLLAGLLCRLVGCARSGHPLYLVGERLVVARMDLVVCGRCGSVRDGRRP